jgi:hypothetical protein
MAQEMGDLEQKILLGIGSAAAAAAIFAPISYRGKGVLTGNSNHSNSERHLSQSSNQKIVGILAALLHRFDRSSLNVWRGCETPPGCTEHPNTGSAFEPVFRH